VKYLCLIPARGGSKGIPGKNLRPIGGKPLIVWTIEQALATLGDVRVVVSTEDEAIAAVARDAGAEVPFARPAELAEDTTATEPVVLHAISELGLRGYRPDAVVLLQATSPIRLPNTVLRAIEHYESTGVDSIVGVVPQSPFLWRWSDPPTADYDVDHRPRRQEITPADLRYRETGSIYVTRTAVYEQHRNRLGGRISLFVMDELEGIDIDTETDLLLAEHALSRLGREQT
jgi:N-acylneuraminate cytidylyltransferase